MIALRSIEKPRYYARKQSFLSGLASLFDLYNSRHYKIDLSFEEDVRSMKSDFDLVGHDLWSAIDKFEKKKERSSPLQ